jgi:hypothetical protein
MVNVTWKLIHSLHTAKWRMRWRVCVNFYLHFVVISVTSWVVASFINVTLSSLAGISYDTLTSTLLGHPPAGTEFTLQLSCIIPLLTFLPVYVSIPRIFLYFALFCLLLETLHKYFKICLVHIHVIIMHTHYVCNKSLSISSSVLCYLAHCKCLRWILK